MGRKPQTSVSPFEMQSLRCLVTFRRYLLRCSDLVESMAHCRRDTRCGNGPASTVSPSICWSYGGGAARDLLLLGVLNGGENSSHLNGYLLIAVSLVKKFLIGSDFIVRYLSF
jgi:hypothetical protein